MDKDTFLKGIADTIQTEEDINLETKLDNLEDWDSLSKISLIAFCDKNFNTKLTICDLESFVTVKDIAIKVGLNDII